MCHSGGWHQEHRLCAIWNIRARVVQGNASLLHVVHVQPLVILIREVDAIRLQANLIRRHGGPNRTLTQEEHPAVTKLGYLHPGVVGEDELVDEYVHDPFAASQLQTEPHGEQVPAGLHQADPVAARQPRRDRDARGRENRAPRRREL